MGMGLCKRRVSISGEMIPGFDVLSDVRIDTPMPIGLLTS
jgi:hypothetical protein